MTPDAERRIQQLADDFCIGSRSQSLRAATAQVLLNFYREAYAQAVADAAKIADEFDFGLDSQAGLVRDIRALADLQHRSKT